MVMRTLTYVTLALFSNMQLAAATSHYNATQESRTPTEVDCTVMVFMAGRNNLAGFAPRNIKQMAAVGSNKHVNILAHLDIRLAGNKQVTRRYYIGKDEIILLNANDPQTQAMDSGDPNTVISFFDWCVTNCPARKYVFVFWNHGFGIIDPQNGHSVDTGKLFVLNPLSNKLELDRSIDFLELIEDPAIDPKGVCWDDSTGNYLTNQKLDFALSQMTKRVGKKLDMVVFDACLMSMLEIANIVKKYAKYMISSQEVVLGPGYNYKEFLSPFLQDSPPEMRSFAKHIVTSYQNTYQKITNDYTQSMIDLEQLDALENNVSEVAQLVMQCLTMQSHQTVKNTLLSCRHHANVTHFDLSSYVDLHHFYLNLLNGVDRFEFADHTQGTHLVSQLKQKIQNGLTLINSTVIANVVGPNLAQAHGISIYFPDRKIHPSYKKTDFAKNNQWGNMLTQLILA